MFKIFLAFFYSLSLSSAEFTQFLKLRNKNAILIDENKLQKVEFYAKYDFEIEFDDGSRFVSVVSILGDFKDNIEPNRFDTSNYITKPIVLSNSGYIDLREFFYEKEIDDVLIKIGKMQSVWGKADGIKLIDILNPQSYSEFILPSFDESRIPLWTLSTQFDFEGSELEIVWILDNTYNKIPNQGASYSFTSLRIIPTIAKGVNLKINNVDKPNSLFKDSDIAFRYSTDLENMELSFYYAYFYHDNFVLYQDYEPSTNSVVLNPKYERGSMYALSMDYSNGNFVYRVELSLNKNKYFLNKLKSKGVQKSDEMAYILGVDWYALEESLLSFQLYQSYILSDNDGLIRDKIDNTLTLLYKKEFMNNTLHSEILTIYNINDSDGLFRVKTKYEIDEESVIYIGLDKFFGNKDGFYGEFKEQSRIVIGIERFF